MEEFMNLVLNQGFAIAMATYMVVRTDKTLKTNTEAINGVKALLQIMLDREERLK